MLDTLPLKMPHEYLMILIHWICLQIYIVLGARVRPFRSQEMTVETQKRKVALQLLWATV